MAYESKENQKTPERAHNSRSANGAAGGYSALSLPNSLMIDLYSDGDNDQFNTGPIIQRRMMMPHRQIPSAEAEADRLSANVRGTNPDAVRREMGRRLNADLSGIRFHSDISSESSNTRMGSRAWTSGRDVYFGKGGFDPKVAAHELVHTVQQGVVRGSVSQSVTPGTVQMWWIFGKKKSDFDEDRTPEDIADNLFRIQAGYTATEEREKEERDAAYAKTYEKELKRIRKNNRGRIREEGSDEQDKENARNLAAQRAANLRVKKKDYVENDDKNKFIEQITTVSKDTYKELLDRWKQAAAELFNYFSDISAQETSTAGKSLYAAANSTFGKNFTLYNQIITKVEMANSTRTDFQEWKNELHPDNGNENEQIEQAKLIITDASSANNVYLKSDEGIRNRSKADWNNKEFYKKAYAKKKTKMDRMAAVYRREKKNRVQANGGIDLIDDPIREEPGSNIISSGTKEKDDLILEGLEENNIKTSSNDEGKKSEDIIHNGMKEKEDSFISEDSQDNIKNNSNIGSGKSENIISTGMKDENDDEEGIVPKTVIKQKIEEYISTSSKHEGMEENDDLIEQNNPNQILLQNGILPAEAEDIFSPANSTVNNVKGKNNKSSFVNHLAKGARNLDQFTMALINQDLLNQKNVYNEIIDPSISGGIGGLTALTGLAGTVTGVADTMRNFHNVDAGGSRMEYINSGLDTLGSAGNMVNGGLAVAKNMANVPLIGETMKTVSELGGQNMVPGLSIATGGASMITGTIEGIRGQKSINKIDDQIEMLSRLSGDEPTKDQQKLMQIFKQGRRISELHRTGGAMKAIGGGIALGTGIALLTGPLAPVTAAVLGIAGAGIGITNFVYGRRKKKNIRKDVTAEEMGFDNWKNEKERVRAQFPGEKLSDKEVREIILKGNGYDVKTRTDAFKQINVKRANMLIEIAEGDGPLKTLAEKVIEALGVHRKKGRYAGGAQKLIAEKLAG